MIPAPIWTNIKTFDGRPFRGLVDLITGGYPCQPFSAAGKRRGTDDERHLFPHIERIIRDIRPRFCFFENVRGHLAMGFDEVYGRLRTLGYSVEAGLFSAEEVGAPHKRERLFILAYMEDSASGCPSRDFRHGREDRRAPSERSLPITARTGQTSPSVAKMCERCDTEHWSVEPDVGRMAHGIADRVDRLRLLGNGVVPAQAALAWRTLMTQAIEKESFLAA